MRLRPSRRGRSGVGGFSLIETIGALVVFSVGVLMVLELSSSLSRQMEIAASTSELVVRAQQRLDSLETLPFDSLSAGTLRDTLTVRGVPYTEVVRVSTVTGVLKRLDVTLAPANGRAGPRHATTSYSASTW